MLYDQTCTTHHIGVRWPVGLTHAWSTGGPLYRQLGRLDAHAGASTWEEGLRWLAEVGGDEPIEEIQFWGHGNFGRANMANQALTVDALSASHPLRPWLDRVAARLTPTSQWWFRTCDTFGGAPGHQFAQHWSDFMGCSVAGHTYVIGIWQSGLHRLQPGDSPHWSMWEGLRKGTPEKPQSSFGSRPWKPNTIHFLQGEVPAGW